jgi:hypothetical protein
MELTRVKDWLIGALGMVLLLGVAVAILWWVASSPADEPGAGPVAPLAEPERLQDPEPPTGLRDDEVWLADVVLDAGTVMARDSVLRDVRAVGQDVVTGPDGSVAGRLAVDVTVPFEVVAAQLGGGTVVRAADDGQATVIRTVEVLGRELRVEATGTVEAEGGRLVVEPRSIDVGGPDVLSGSLATAVRRFVSIEHDIEGLPEGLVLQEVSVHSDGFRADLLGADVDLGP